MHIRNLPGLEYKTFVGGGGPRASTFTQEQPANQKRCVAAPCAAAETFPCAPHPRRGHRHAGRLPRPSRPDRCVLRAVLREPWRRRPATGGSAPPVATSAPTRRPLRAEAAWGVLKGKLEGLRRDGKFRFASCQPNDALRLRISPTRHTLLEKFHLPWTARACLIMHTPL